MKQLYYKRDKKNFKKYLNINYNNQTHDDDIIDTDEDYFSDDLGAISKNSSAKETVTNGNHVSPSTSKNKIIKKSKSENSLNSKKAVIFF